MINYFNILILCIIILYDIHNKKFFKYYIYIYNYTIITLNYNYINKLYKKGIYEYFFYIIKKNSIMN